MLIEFLTSRFSYLVDGIIGIVGFVMLVKYANWSLGITFSKDVLPTIKERDPGAYFGRRLIALALAFGAIALAGAIQ